MLLLLLACSPSGGSGASTDDTAGPADSTDTSSDPADTSSDTSTDTSSDTSTDTSDPGLPASVWGVAVTCATTPVATMDDPYRVWVSSGFPVVPDLPTDGCPGVKVEGNVHTAVTGCTDEQGWTWEGRAQWTVADDGSVVFDGDAYGYRRDDTWNLCTGVARTRGGDVETAGLRWEGEAGETCWADATTTWSGERHLATMTLYLTEFGAFEATGWEEHASTCQTCGISAMEWTYTGEQSAVVTSADCSGAVSWTTSSGDSDWAEVCD